MHVIIECDGGSRGNPGPAGYGAVLKNPAGEEIGAVNDFIGEATNNVAEYQGVIAGMKAARNAGATRLDVRLDSKLVVEQLTGRWKVKHPDMKVLASTARTLAATFEHIAFTWIPRAENARADELANIAMDNKAQTHDGHVEPVTPARSQTPPSAGPGWSTVSTTPTRLLLLRHGQTPLSVERRYSGRGNPELTELGQQQAQAAATYLSSKGGISAVVSSPLTRCQQTAQHVASALGLEVTTRDNLIETDFGTWEGLTFAEVSAQDPAHHAAWMKDISLAPPHGESFAEVITRIHTEITQLCQQYAGQTIVVVSHVTPIKCALKEALNVGPELLFSLHLDLASLSIAEFYSDGPTSVRLVNDTSYLVG